MNFKDFKQILSFFDYDMRHVAQARAFYDYLNDNFDGETADVITDPVDLLSDIHALTMNSVVNDRDGDTMWIGNTLFLIHDLFPPEGYYYARDEYKHEFIEVATEIRENIDRRNIHLWFIMRDDGNIDLDGHLTKSENVRIIPCSRVEEYFPGINEYFKPGNRLSDEFIESAYGIVAAAEMLSEPEFVEMFLDGGKIKIYEDKRETEKNKKNFYSPVFYDSPLIAKRNESGRLLRMVLNEVARGEHLFVYGEDGTGREEMAMALHHLNHMSKPLPDVFRNYFSIASGGSEEILDKELFGYGDYVGLIKMADGGTLFIDRVEKMPVSIQQRLAAFIKTGNLVDRSKNKVISSKVALVLGTTEIPQKLISDGLLIPELYYQIQNAVKVPPLREWDWKDILSLTDQIVWKYSEEVGLEFKYLEELHQIGGQYHYTVIPRHVIEEITSLAMRKGNYYHFRKLLLNYLKYERVVKDEDIFDVGKVLRFDGE